ncbi:MAG: acylphosphatase [Nitrospirae bacterium]|nr:acylphosphatase [Nitrospirota bacterium]MBI4837716.1 acylphosphatase [Nitrospirota bacterium]
MEKGRVHLRIRGFVQGVFFRAGTRDMARGLGLTGWVRNMPDGSVEAVFEGTEDRLKTAVAWCHKGPPGARVSNIDEKWLGYTGEFSSFEVKYGFG